MLSVYTTPMDTLYKTLKEYGKVKRNVLLSKLTTFKIGGPADALVTVTSREKLAELLTFLSGEGVDFLIIGGGANVLMPDDGFRGVAIKVACKDVQHSGAKLEADAGIDLGDLVLYSIQQSLGGLEWAAGIPGSLGGAIRGNAGARYAFTGGEMKDILSEVFVWRNGEVFTLTPADCTFGYRDSAFKHNHDVILGASFTLQAGNKGESVSVVQKVLTERKGKHASEPSAGSFFKNVPLEQWKQDTSLLPERFLRYKKIAAGWLIEQCGLKGYAVGGAMVSQEHGNFIINHKHATQAEVLAVVEAVKEKVYTTFGVELEEEVHIIT